MDTIHVIPVDDLLPHDTTGEACPCHPRITRSKTGTVIVHQAWDGREHREVSDTYVVDFSPRAQSPFI